MPSEASDFAASASRDPKVQSVAIDITNTSDPETFALHTPPTGQRFAVYHLFLQIETTTGALTLLSGSNAITGDVNFSNADDDREWRNAPLPVFKGVNQGEAFNLKLAGSTGIQVNGFALVGDVQP